MQERSKSDKLLSLLVEGGQVPLPQEYESKLANEFVLFKTKVKEYRLRGAKSLHKNLRDLFNDFVGIGRLGGSDFFAVLKRLDKKQWKKAINDLLAMIKKDMMLKKIFRQENII